MKGWEKLYQASINHKKAGVAILITEKSTFQDKEYCHR